MTWYLGIAVGALELIMLALMIRAMLTAPSDVTRLQKMRSFHIGRSGYKGVKEASKGADDDAVPMIERPASR